VRRGVLVAVIAGLAAVAAAEQVVVHQDVDVKSEKNPLADPVESVSSNTQLEILSRDGGWVRVRTPSGKEGFLSSDELASNVGVGDLSGSGDVRGVSAAAAGRGLQDDAEKYAGAKHLSTKGVNTMIAWGNAVTAKDLRDFAKAGNVGPKKYRR
jgi:hypothetical protein